MKKSTILKIIVFIFALILVFCGMILYSKDINNLNFIKNVRQAIDEENNITAIDVTGIELGKETQHEHVYKTMYDEEKHWEECIVCGEKRNEVAHSCITTWASGTASCVGGNYYTRACKCGYSIQGKRPHVWTGNYVTSDLRHSKKCSICGNGIGGRNGLYYKDSYGKGEIYNDENGPLDAYFYCYKSDGSKITCNNLGTCTMCKKAHTSKKHALMIDKTSNKIFCMVCKDEFGTCYNDMTRDSNIPGTYIVTSTIKLNNGATYDSISGMPNTSGAIVKSTRTITNIDSSKANFTLKNEINLKSGWKIGVVENLNIFIAINGIKCNLSIMPPETLYPDIIKPTIGNISKGDDIKWNKSKMITISGTENYCNNVKVKIVDDKQNVVFSGETTVSSNNYSISCTPDIEAGIEGRTFKTIVTDACENSTEQEFTVAKIDSIAPEITSNDEIDRNWAREKSFIATATDHGIGNVQIAFNDVNDYKLATKNGTEYSRKYKLTGDVYSPTKARVFYKDELNNISSQEITIDKLDNTAPTITGSNFNNNKLAIEANDIKEGIGEGSGVAKYRFITSDTRYENPVVSKADSTEVNIGEDIVIPNIDKVKYVYVVAEDAVGNVSESYEIEVPQLNLRTEVNLSAANGKGGVDLDWSGYDPSNKVFKAYQKKEGAEEFESISTVDFYKEIEPIKVLNVYPLSNSNKNIPTVTFKYLDGITDSLPKSASLKVWLEGGTMTESGKATTFEAYGKNPYTGQQIIKVTPVSSENFNNNPDMIWNYDVVMFGTWDGNGGPTQQPNDEAVKIIEKYIQSGYGVLAGHDSIASAYKSLIKLKKYFNIELGRTVGSTTDTEYNFTWAYGANKIIVNNSGIITNFPYVIPIGSKLTIPFTHTLYQATKGNIWMTLVDGTDNWNKLGSINNYYNAGGKGNPQYYLTTYNNTAMIQTGHSNAESTADERKVLANTLFYLKQRTTDTAFTDNSAQDLKAPNAPIVNATREGNKIKLTHNATDNGSEYKYYVEAYDIADQSILLSKSNERTETVTTGTKGYYYIIDNNNENIDFDVTNATYVEGESSLINLSNNGKYIHMKAVDVAGNISEETTIKIEVEIPDLVLTSKVNLSGANGKGEVELDWSTFELENVYYVVYRKEKSSTNWDKIVSIEDKLTAKTYTDNLGNDKAKPTVPTINIVGNSSENSIDLTLEAQDNGSDYIYYVEAYDAITETLVNSSN